MLSIIYVHYKTEKELISSIESVLGHHKNNNYQIIVVDNSSSKSLKGTLSKWKKVIYIDSGKNIGFGAACNKGAKKAIGEYLLFLNPDTIVSNNSISDLLLAAKNDPKIGVIGPQMISQKKALLPTINKRITPIIAMVVYTWIDKVFKNNPFSTSFWMKKISRKKTLRVDVVSGACMLIPKNIFNRVHGFDENFFLYFEEQDICERIRQAGFDVVFYPKSKIVHLLGRSLTDKNKIQQYFEKSRFIYMRKHFGLLKAAGVEFFLRLNKPDNIFFILFILVSFLVNTYRLSALMLFIGDMARDFLAARDMILYHKFALVGIPSSVTWLHQGPTAVWGIALSFLVTNYNPVAPAYFFAALGAITTGLLYKLIKNAFDRKTAILAALLFACSPMAVVNARMPYHTSLVPFFALLFFIGLYKLKRGKVNLPVVGFLAGLLMLVELSNIVVLIILPIYLGRRFFTFPFGTLLKGLGAFLLALSPFILYDLLNGPTYIKFPLWIVYRLIRHAPEDRSGLVANIWSTFYQQISSSIIPNLPVLSILLLVSSLVLMVYLNFKKGSKFENLMLLWCGVPIIAFILHKSPGTAYFSLLYPAISFAAAFMLLKIMKFRAALLIVVIICVINVFNLIKNDFYVSSVFSDNPMPPTNYIYGSSWTQINAQSKAIMKDARGNPIEVIGEGIYALYQTSLDPYKYLIWYNGGKLGKGGVSYIITSNNNRLDSIYQDRNILIVKKRTIPTFDQ